MQTRATGAVPHPLRHYPPTLPPLPYPGSPQARTCGVSGALPDGGWRDGLRLERRSRRVPEAFLSGWPEVGQRFTRGWPALDRAPRVRGRPARLAGATRSPSPPAAVLRHGIARHARLCKRSRDTARRATLRARPTFSDANLCCHPSSPHAKTDASSAAASLAWSAASRLCERHRRASRLLGSVRRPAAFVRLAAGAGVLCRAGPADPIGLGGSAGRPLPSARAGPRRGCRGRSCALAPRAAGTIGRLAGGAPTRSAAQASAQSSAEASAHGAGQGAEQRAARPPACGVRCRPALRPATGVIFGVILGAILCANPRGRPSTLSRRPRRGRRRVERPGGGRIVRGNPRPRGR
jgi:hypothetical protein